MIQTSYFAKTGNHEKSIAISRGIPNRYNGVIDQRLAPSWSILNEYKKSTQSIDDKERYVRRYKKEILGVLNVHQIARELDDRILLCYLS